MKTRKVSYSVKGPAGERVSKKSEKWYGVWKDFRGILRRIPLDENPKIAAHMAGQIDQLNSIASSGQVIPPALSNWIDKAPPTVVATLAKWGIISTERVAAAQPLEEHVDDWVRELAARGNCKRHVDQLKARVMSVFKACKMTIWSQLSASKVMKELGDRRKERTGAAGMSAQTFNHHVGSLKQFCSWMVRDGRAMTSPLEHLQKIDVKADRRHDRRAFEPDEVRLLLAAAENGPTRHAIAGVDRAMLYEVAVTTGLRFSELKSLTRSSFKIDGDDPTVTIQAGSAKNKKLATLPLPMATAERLRVRLTTLLPNAVALPAPQKEHAAKMIRADLEAARTAWIKEADADPAERERREQSDFLAYENSKNEFADFHALRHTRGVWLFTHHAVSPREAVELMRVSGLALVDRYTRSFQLKGTAAIADRGPDLSRPKDPAEDARKIG